MDAALTSNTELPPLRAHILVGATASGKSSLAMQWAQHTGNLIISCDSMQVYQGLDIGTAKPTAEEQQAVRHALIDTTTLAEVYSAADWADAASMRIEAENAAGRVPLICGGTGFYLRALLQGLSAIPDVPQAIRQHWQQRLQQDGHAALYAELQRLDPPLAAQIPPTDSQRLLRALSVQQATGQPLSYWQQQQRPPRPLAGSILYLSLPREQLRARIAERFQQMMEAGWLDEVAWLQTQQLAPTHPALRAVGYRQLLAYLRQEITQQAAIDEGITATRRYAKRQNTWFRHQLSYDIHGDAQQLKEFLWSHTTPL